MARDMMKIVADLLAKAEDASVTGPERDEFNRKAAELCAKYGVDAALARAQQGKGGPKFTDTLVMYEAAFDDDCQNELAELAYRLAEALGAKCLHSQDGLDKVVKIVAYSSDVARWEVLFTSLSLQMFDGVVREVHGSDAESKRWMRGFTTIVVDRVMAAELGALRTADDAGHGATVAIRDKGTEVVAQFRAEFPHTRKGSISRAGVSAAGMAAGRRANIGGTGVGGSARAAVR